MSPSYQPPPPTSQQHRQPPSPPSQQHSQPSPPSSQQYEQSPPPVSPSQQHRQSSTPPSLQYEQSFPPPSHQPLPSPSQQYRQPLPPPSHQHRWLPASPSQQLPPPVPQQHRQPFPPPSSQHDGQPHSQQSPPPPSHQPRQLPPSLPHQSPSQPSQRGSLLPPPSHQPRLSPSPLTQQPRQPAPSPSEQYGQPTPPSSQHSQTTPLSSQQLPPPVSQHLTPPVSQQHRQLPPQLSWQYEQPFSLFSHQYRQPLPFPSQQFPYLSSPYPQQHGQLLIRSHPLSTQQTAQLQFGPQFFQFPPLPSQLPLPPLTQQFALQAAQQFGHSLPPITQRRGQSLPLPTQHFGQEQALPPPAKRPRHTQPLSQSPSVTVSQPNSGVHYAEPHPDSALYVEHQSFIHYADYLRDFYQTSELPVGNKWPPTPSKKFVNLAVISREDISSKEMRKFQEATIHGDINDIFATKAPIDLQNIIDSKPGEKLQCVLVEGAPGVGKTTLAWEISKRWGKRELFQQYIMVMLLRLRDETVQNSTNVTDFIFHENRGYQQEISRYLIYTRGKGIFIILEGLDELPQHLLTHSSIFTHLLSGKILPQATILITSRPSATVQLWRNWKERVTQHIEILGFTPQNLNEYIKSVVSSKELSGFNNYLTMNTHIKLMMYIPIHAAIVVEIYRCCQRSHKPLPTTVTELYTSLTQTILLRYLDCHPSYKENHIDLQQFTDLPSPVYQDFYKLTKIAYNGVVRQKLIFYYQHQEVQHLGFMDTVTELFPNQCSVSYSYNFLHLSVQEYLASYYVSLMSIHEQEQLLMEMHTEKYLQNMIRFLAGITQFKNMNRIIVKKVIEKECEVFSDGTLELSVYPLQLLHECGYANIIDDHPLYSCTLTDNSQPFEFSVLGHCIAKSNYKWRLQLKGGSRYMQSVDKVDLLVQALKSHNNPEYSIESIKCNCISSAWVKHLLIEMPQFVLQQLWKQEIENCEDLKECVIEHILSPISGLHILRIYSSVGESGAAGFATALQSNNTLTQLYIGGNRIGDSGAAAIASGLQSNNTLTQLDIGGDGIGERGAAAIAKALQSNNTLTQLDFGKNGIGDSGAAAIATALQSNNTLTQLNVNVNGIGDCGAAAIATALQSNNTLTQLNIGINEIGDSGAAAIATALQSNNTLTQLNIGGNRINESGTVIAKALQSNNTLTQLDIGGNVISDSGAVAIATALQSNNTLTQLDIGVNGINDSGAAAIATVLQSNNTLTQLDIGGNGIGDSGAAAIITALQSNNTLTQLDISKNGISESGAAAIATALQSNNTLTQLDIGRNGIGDSGAAAIATALQSNNTLTQLDISENGISESGAAAIATALQSNNTLTQLDIRGNRISCYATRRDIDSALWRNKRLTQ